MIKPLTYLITISFWVLTSFVHGSNTKIKGVVLSSNDNLPINKASVSVYHEGNILLRYETDSTGYFEFLCPAQRIWIYVNAPGFQRDSMEIYPNQGDEFTIRFYCKPLGHDTKKIVLPLEAFCTAPKLMTNARSLLPSWNLWDFQLVEPINDTIIINNNVMIVKLDFGNTGTTLTLNLLKEEGEYNMINHTIRTQSSDCNSRNIQLGDFEISDTTITLYSYWARVGDAYGSPCGVRKQVYSVCSLGKLHKIESVGYFKEFGLIFTDGEELEYSHETDSLFESYYQTNFITGLKALQLDLEVRMKMDSVINMYVGDWYEIAPLLEEGAWSIKNGFGICW